MNAWNLVLPLIYGGQDHCFENITGSQMQEMCKLCHTNFLSMLWPPSAPNIGWICFVTSQVFLIHYKTLGYLFSTSILYKNFNFQLSIWYWSWKLKYVYGCKVLWIKQSLQLCSSHHDVFHFTYKQQHFLSPEFRLSCMEGAESPCQHMWS